MKNKLVPEWENLLNNSSKFTSSISKIHYEYYCEYYGLSLGNYYNSCIVSNYSPEKLLKI